MPDVSRTSCWLVTAAAVAVTLGGCTVGAAGHGHSRPAASTAMTPDARGRLGAPLAGPPPNGFATKKDVGEVFSNGQLIVFNTGDAPVRIVKVTPQLTGTGLSYLGALVAGLGREIGSMQDERGFPPTSAPLLGKLTPAKGAVLEPGKAADKRGVELILGFKVLSPGRSTARAVRIDYQYHGQAHTGVWTSTMAVCVPRSSPGRCDQEYGDGSGLRS
jgi:hypothetical protein